MVGLAAGGAAYGVEAYRDSGANEHGEKQRTDARDST
jgi:hypothetical protein